MECAFSEVILFGERLVESNKEGGIKMEKEIDFRKSVYDIVSDDPEIANIMEELGFTEVTKKAMLNSVGKLMTI